MNKEPKTYTYKVEDIFEDIPEDPENVLMNFPQEILAEKGWKEGTRLKIELGDKGTLIITEVLPEENDEQEQ
jgi:hypothetical protein